MASSSIRPLCLLLVCLFHGSSVAREDRTHEALPQPTIIKETSSSDGGVKSYIILVSNPNPSSLNSLRDREAWYRSFLPPTARSSGNDGLIYSYHDVLTGFATRLTSRELEAVKAKPGYVLSFPDKMAKLQTTRTPDFLGLRRSSGLWRQTNFGRTAIVGVLDTGILLNHSSFSPLSLPKPPSKWVGKCEFPAGVCTNKVIGARSFLVGLCAMAGESHALQAEVPYDQNGHDTHVASTVAGWFTEDAEYLGFARGTAAGMAPQAHLTIYKVCSAGGCAYSDLLMGMNTAVSDGMDIISLSITSSPLPLHLDPIAIGRFGAAERASSHLDPIAIGGCQRRSTGK